MPKCDDKVSVFFNRMEIDTSSIFLKYDNLNNLYSYAAPLLGLNTRFQNVNYQEIGMLKMMQNLVAHDYDSIYGFKLYYFDQIRQLPIEEVIFFLDKEIEKYETKLTLYDIDKRGLMEVALSCLKHGLRFPLFNGMDQYSGINFSEHGWFENDEAILCFYKHIYKKDDAIENEKWKLLSPGAILLGNVSNPFLSETTFETLINMMSDEEKSTFYQAVFDLDQRYTKNTLSYEFMRMFFNYFPTVSKDLGCNKLHLAVVNFDVVEIRNIIKNYNNLLLEASTPRDWSELYSDDPIQESFTPLQLAEYKLSEFEKALAIEQKQTMKSKYTDNELFFTFRVEQMRKIVSILTEEL